MTSNFDMQVDGFDIDRGHLHLYSDCLTLLPAKWNWEQVEIIRQLIEAHIEPIVHLDVAEDGTTSIASIEAGEFLPRFSAPGGVS